MLFFDFLKPKSKEIPMNDKDTIAAMTSISPDLLRIASIFHEPRKIADKKFVVLSLRHFLDHEKTSGEIKQSPTYAFSEDQIKDLIHGLQVQLDSKWEGSHKNSL